MITDKTKQWIEAGKRLAINSNDEVLCPLCNKGILRVVDSDKMNEKGLIERFLICANCDAWNSIRMYKP